MAPHSEERRRTDPARAGPAPAVARRTDHVSGAALAASWAVVPALFVAMSAAAALHPDRVYGSPALVLACNLVLLAGLAAVATVFLARSFLARGELGLLLLATGAAVWSLTAVAAGATSAAGPNFTVTVHNVGALIAGACHALGAATLQGRSWPVPRRGAAAIAAGALAVLAVGLVAWLAASGAFPAFYVDGRGGTPVRQAVLSAAAAAFAVGAAGLARGSSCSAFRHWYALGLGLITVGLYGVLVQETVGAALAWLGRGAQYLGGLAMLAATVASVRESQAWALPLRALLRQTEARYRSLFENMSEGLLVAEAGEAAAPCAGPVVDLNPAAELLTGVPRAEALRQPLRELFPAEAAPGLEDACARVLDGGEPSRFAVTLPGGRHLQVVAFGPEPQRVALLFSDDSGRQQYEQALLEANARLSEVDGNRSRFLAVLSHELRNPLAPIRNALVSLERSDPASDTARRAREILGRQVEQLTHLVDELLDLTRVSSGKIRLERAAVDVCELVRRAGEDRRDFFAARGLQLGIEIEDAPLRASADAARVVQILGNLLQNAAKFTPAGGQVLLSAARDGAAAEIRVRDTGVGIDPALLSSLFEPFVQGEATLSRAEGGLGLGLALVKGLVELHGGTIEARSDGPGHGAEMIVRLPLATD